MSSHHWNRRRSILRYRTIISVGFVPPLFHLLSLPPHIVAIQALPAATLGPIELRQRMHSCTLLAVATTDATHVDLHRLAVGVARPETQAGHAFARESRLAVRHLATRDKCGIRSGCGSLLGGHGPRLCGCGVVPPVWQARDWRRFRGHVCQYLLGCGTSRSRYLRFLRSDLERGEALSHPAGGRTTESGQLPPGPHWAHLCKRERLQSQVEYFLP
mmetsp:Transcript_26529/g.74551  ORF Transcript_26529/g.74551 Transcript_26529/m.74551 type:complete len:216 (+) Transcript_26529:1057-1704(+)